MASVIANPERQLLPFPGGRAVLRTVAVPPDIEPVPRSLPMIRPADHGRTGLAELERATMEARRALEEAVVAAAVAARRAMDVAAVLDETLAVLTAAEAEHVQPPTAAEGFAADISALSPREREVLALVAEGRTNKAIADALFVSPNTIKTHVGSLLSKLRAESRAQLAAIAARSGMLTSPMWAP